jgi:potassium-transporting ATPase KdpC subunit
MSTFLRQLRPAVVVLALFTVLAGIIYPVVATGIGQLAFRDEANGSLIVRDGHVVGSALLGQSFAGQAYFHPRPSAAGADGYDGSASSGSNLGPLSPDLRSAVEQRVAAYRTENGLAADQAVPVDAVTASGSGLDPDISVANARLQSARVAAARGLAPAEVGRLIDEHTDGRVLGVLGVPAVDVLQLNLALDDATAGGA